MSVINSRSLFALGVLVSSLFVLPLIVMAVPPASPYGLGAILDPECGPTDTNCTVVAPSPATGTTTLVTVGTVATGVWNGTVVGTAYGGTGTSTLGAANTVAYSDGNGLAYTNAATANYVLMADATTAVPYWTTTSTLGISGGSSAWTTSGSDIYYTTGNVGIGTTTPSGIFDVASSSGTSYFNVSTAGKVFVNDGTGAVLTNYPNSQMYVMQSTAATSSDDIAGLLASAAADDTNQASGLYGEGKTSASKAGVGVVGEGFVNDTTDSALPIGVVGYSRDVHGSYPNMAFYAEAANGAVNYSFYSSNAAYLFNMGNVGLGLGYYGSALVPEGNLHIRADEATDATFYLDADEGDDNADTWIIKSLATGNDLSFTNHTTEIMRLTDDGKVGIGTTTPEFKLDINGDGGIIARGTYDTGTILSTAGAGTRLMWYPKKAAFRVGFVDDEQWNDSNIGNYSTVAGGSNSIASGIYSTVAGGLLNTASDEQSFVGGGSYNTASSYASSVGGGNDNTASGYYSTVAGGLSNTASGSRSFVGGGYGNTASGDYSSAFGYSMTVAGNYSLGINVSSIAQNLTQANTVAIMGGNVGIGTTTPDVALQVVDTTTSTFSVGAVGSPACIRFRDADDGGWTYCTYLDGVQTCSADSCL